LEQNSAVFKDGHHIWSRRVPVGHVLKAHVYDAPDSFVIMVGHAIQFIPFNHMSIHDELDF
jgi:hypothetical protein